MLQSKFFIKYVRNLKIYNLNIIYIRIDLDNVPVKLSDGLK
jgi:hypothetical protein